MPLIQDDEGREEEARKDSLIERLLETRTILLADPIGKDSAHDVITKLLLLDEEDPKAPINLYINSPGGEVDAGFAVFDIARYISAPVRCISAGLTASAAVVVLLAAEKKRRLSLAHSRFLLHQPSTGVRGSTADIQIEANEIVKIRHRINKLIADETGQPVENVDKDTRRNYWLDAEQAQEYGLISRIIRARKDLDK